ncbi:MAG TPA: DUF6325 family protein [Ktedonobacterales bacterium]
MALGPLEYLVVKFEGNHFTGEIMPELQALRDKGLVRIVDLIFIQKDKDGTVSAREISDLDADEAKRYGPIAGDVQDLLTIEDIDDVAGKLPNNSSAAIALLEHTWAIRLRETILKARGEVLEAGFVPMAEVEALTAELAAMKAEAQA